MSYKDASHLPPEQQFWYNTYTHAVEEGAQSDYRQLIGPYASREEAQHALERAAQRNEEWEDSNARWAAGHQPGHHHRHG
jgi:hypothetical protein